MAAAGIFNHAMTAGQALTGKAVTPMDSTTSGTSSTQQFQRRKQRFGHYLGQ